MSHRRITVFDTTLRDGEQSPGIALQPHEKVEIAVQLQRPGVDVIEAGFAGASPGEFEGVRAVAAAVDGPTVACFARVRSEDVEAAGEALAGANAFAHEAGIHQDGMLKDERTYQIVDPRRLGFATTLPLGKHGGRHAFAPACADRGIELAGVELDVAFRRFKERADAHGVVALEDIFEEVAA